MNFDGKTSKWYATPHHCLLLDHIETLAFADMFKNCC